MNIRELIDELLNHNTEPNTEVRIEVAGKSIATYRVNAGRSGGYKVLTIEPDEDLMTVEDAKENMTANA